MQSLEAFNNSLKCIKLGVEKFDSTANEKGEANKIEQHNKLSVKQVEEKNKNDEWLIHFYVWKNKREIEI